MMGIAAIHPPCAKHGEGDREAVEGPRAFGPSATRLRQGLGARHLPIAAQQGGNI